MLGVAYANIYTECSCPYSRRKGMWGKRLSLGKRDWTRVCVQTTTPRRKHTWETWRLSFKICIAGLYQVHTRGPDPAGFL
jgi:hypothetical protein